MKFPGERVRFTKTRLYKNGMGLAKGISSILVEMNIAEIIEINKLKQMAMLKYTKTVLQKVSFNKDLFQKELRKSVTWLKRDEIILLQAWCIINFGNVYQDVISEVFNNSL